MEAYRVECMRRWEVNQAMMNPSDFPAEPDGLFEDPPEPDGVEPDPEALPPEPNPDDYYVDTDWDYGDYCPDCHRDLDLYG